MGKPNPPEPPDPRETAAAQTGTNVSTAIANTAMGNVTRIGPDGTVRMRQTGTYDFTDPTTGEAYSVPTYTQTTRLDPAGRRTDRLNDETRVNLARTGRNVSEDLGRMLRDPFELENLPRVRQGAGARNRAEAALMERMNPQLEQDRAALQTRLANQGIALGSTAYDREMDTFGRATNDARLGAILSAGTEADRIYNQSLGARQQAISEQFQARNQPINEVSALLSGAQVQAPMAPTPNVASMPTVDFAGLTAQNYNQRMMGYQQQMQARNAMMGGLFDVASAGVGVI